MKKPTDIERLFQRMGLTDVRYHEFVSDQDPVRARENWSLVDSSVETAEEEPASGHVPLSRPAPPVRRTGAFYDRVAELRGARSSRAPEATEPLPHQSEEPPRAEEPGQAGESTTRPGGPLRDVFARVRRDTPDTERPPSEPGGKTPLSEVFKRLS